MATTDNFLRRVQKKLTDIDQRIRDATAELEKLKEDQRRYAAAKDVYEQEMAGRVERPARKSKATGKRGPTIGDTAEKILSGNDGPMTTGDLANKVKASGVAKGKNAYSSVVKTLGRDERFYQPSRALWDLASRRQPAMLSLPIADSPREAGGAGRSQAV